MESIEARALKSSCFFSEIAMTSATTQALGVGEEYLFVSATGAGDDFSVDEFFDLQGLSEEEGEEEEEKSSSSASSLSLSSQDQVDEGSSFSGSGLSGFSSAADGLPIPADDMKELELWSHLMDDTLCDDIFACPTRNVYVKTGPNVEKGPRFEGDIKPATVEATPFPPPVFTKPRSKRLRTASVAWFSCSLLKPEYSSSSSSSSPAPGFAFPQVVQETGAGSTENIKPRVKNLKRKPAALEDGGSLAMPVPQRRCTHCQVQKTPQWRTGPLGPKTLCNACGVRFKSGRLFPEYRPACSPTFSSVVHSNSHRKVLEMRTKKMSESTEPVSVQQF